MTTSTNAQWNPGSTTQTSKTITGLTPGGSYVLLVRAYKNNPDGSKTYSDYASIQYIDSGVAASGLNALAVNNGTDILLNGGSIFAQNTNNPFPSNTGKFNVVSGTTTGTGVILNNTGVAAFKNGTKEFYLDAATGNAYFAGTIDVGALTNAGAVTSSSLNSTLSNYRTTTSTIGAGFITTGILKSGNFNGPTDGSSFSTAGAAINLDGGEFITPHFRIDASGNTFFQTGASGNYIGISSSSYDTIKFFNQGFLSPGIIKTKNSGIYGELYITSPNNSGNYDVSAALILRTSSSDGSTSIDMLSDNTNISALSAGAVISSGVGSFGVNGLHGISFTQTTGTPSSSDLSVPPSPIEGDIVFVYSA